jgi:hypothetical protein
MTAKDLIIDCIIERIKFRELYLHPNPANRKDFEELEQLLKLKQIIEGLHIFDAQSWLGEKKDIWNHPRISDRTDKMDYDLSELLEYFGDDIINKLNTEL